MVKNIHWKNWACNMENINEDAIEELTKLLIKEDFETKGQKPKYFKMTTKSLIRFCIRLLKTIEYYKED